jgi:hypothetical protein
MQIRFTVGKKKRDAQGVGGWVVFAGFSGWRNLYPLSSVVYNFQCAPATGYSLQTGSRGRRNKGSDARKRLSAEA